MADSRTLRAFLKELAASPIPVSEVHLHPDGSLASIVLAAKARQEDAKPTEKRPEKEEDEPKRRKTLIDSLRLIPALQVPSG